jgi:hypothetical protein
MRRANCRAEPFAWLAAAIGVLYGLVSAYWALGGTGLLDTVGAGLERDARSGGVALTAGLWGVVVLKLVASVLPVLALRAGRGSGRRRWLRRLAGVEAVVLTGYGGILTGLGLLVQAGVITRDRHADQRALAWHAFLWDPWFLAWGVAGAAALHLSGRGDPATPTLVDRSTR